MVRDWNMCLAPTALWLGSLNCKSTLACRLEDFSSSPCQREQLDGQLSQESVFSSCSSVSAVSLHISGGRWGSPAAAGAAASTSSETGFSALGSCSCCRRVSAHRAWMETLNSKVNHHPKDTASYRTSRCALQQTADLAGRQWHQRKHAPAQVAASRARCMCHTYTSRLCMAIVHGIPQGMTRPAGSGG